MRFPSVALATAILLFGPSNEATAYPSSAPVPTLAQSGVGERHRLYDDNGDLVFEATSRSLMTFHNRTHWRNAAYCMALNDLVEYNLDELRLKASQKGKTYDESGVQNVYLSMDRENERWRAFALHRLRIDHPRDPNLEASLDVEIAAAKQVIHALDWSPEENEWSTRWGTRATACHGYRNNIQGLIYNMENGRGAGSRGAPPR